MHYETQRLALRLLHESSAAEVLDFYLRNKELFEAWEPKRPTNFYTAAYQTALLKCEFTLAVQMKSVRFWIFLKNQPDKIIGTLSFQNIQGSVFHCCSLGYKLDENYQHQGYATEALTAVLPIISKELHIHRIEALVSPDNLPSCRLLERLGFTFEGVRRSCIYLRSGWTDHLQYSFIFPDE